MRRSLFTLLMPVVLVLASIGPVLGAKPTHGPAELLPALELAAGEVCDFALTLATTELRAKTSIWEDDDGTVRFLERGWASGYAANAEGDRVTHSGGYRIAVVLHSDGSVQVSVSGALFAWYFPGDPIVGLAPGAYAVHGHGTESYAPDGSLMSAQFYGGRVTDLCQALDPAA